MIFFISLIYFLINFISFSNSIPIFEKGILDLSKEVIILEDKNSSLRINDILKGKKNANFQLGGQDSYLFNKDIKKYWIDLTFYNDSEETEILLLGWFQSIGKGSNIYVIKGDSYVKYDLGDFSRSKLSIKSVDLGAKLNIESQSQVRIIIEIKLDQMNVKTNFYISDLYSQINFYYNVSLYSLVVNILMLFSIFIMMVLWISTKNNYFIYFSFYSVMNLLGGYIKRYGITLVDILGELPFTFFVISLRIGQTLFFLLFIYDFLKTRLFIKKLGYIFNGLIWTTFALNFLYFFKHFFPIFNVFQLISFLMLLIVYFVFCVILFKIKYRYALLFIIVYVLGIMSFFVSFVVEQVLGIYAGNIPPYYFSMYDVASDLLIVMVLIIDRMHVMRVEKAIDKNSERFVFALGTSDSEAELFSKSLLSLRSYIEYDRSYFVVEDMGLRILASVPKREDDDKSIKSFIKDNIEEINKNYFTYFNSKSVTKYFKNASSSVVIPIIIEDEHLGYAVLISRFDEFYSNVELGLIKDFANKAALVVEHFRKMKIINEKEKAIEIYENMGLFHKNSTHEIKIPLFSLSDSLREVKRIYEKEHNNERKDILQFIESMEESVEASMEQIEESLSMVGEEQKLEFDVEYIKNSMNSLRKLCTFLEIDLEEDFLLPLDTKLFGPQKSIKNVVNMIFKNAIEALEKSKKKKKVIKITFIVQRGKLCISIMDNGYGIDEKVKRKLFKLYTEGKMLSSGQGLMICKSIINRLGGDIEINSSPNLFTKVDFSFDVLVKEEKKEDEKSS